MKSRNQYTTRKSSGRLFTAKKLEQYRKDLCLELRKTNKSRIADTYEKMTLKQFAANGGYIIVKSRIIRSI